MKTTYFHAGGLFTLGQLAGNALLSSAIASESDGRYRAVLPQDLEIGTDRNSTIRDLDFVALLTSDVALFNFDGPELDSGTVVEFMMAKFADIPAVIVRSDFRRGGDNHADPWNLMLSDYPRTRQIMVHSMQLYHSRRVKLSKDSAVAAVTEATRETAKKIISAFDEVRLAAPVLPPKSRKSVYAWLQRFAGIKKDPELFLKILEKRIGKNLL